ncbi:hypothetical protein EMIHUDRAFT_445817, partial [Emiliania huxleyi CCMP1516]|uniref:Uncharacterized protein n=2 Tax=Emiliania huxleyi TaxID=2903 RepID=A0A0D3IQY5_EMIH1
MHMPQRIRRRVHAAAVHTLRTHAASQSEMSREEPRLANRSSPGVRECAAPLLLQEARPLRRLRRHRVLVRRDVCGALCRRRGLCRPGLASDAANHALQAGLQRGAARRGDANHSRVRRAGAPKGGEGGLAGPAPPPRPFAAPLCVIPCRRPPDVLPACGPRVVARPPRSSFSRAARFTFSTPPLTARDAGGIAVGKRMVGVDDNAIIS